MRLYLGVTTEDELYFIDWDKADNEQRKTFSLCGGCYDNPKTEKEGEDEAYERLSSSDYWEELYNLDELPNVLSSKIDYKEVAEDVLSSDGWENINGEYSHFGEVENEEVYLNYSCGGQHQEERSKIKDLWISENEFKTINKIWKERHLKPLRINEVDFMGLLFDKYKNLCSDEEVLIKYLKSIQWRQ